MKKWIVLSLLVLVTSVQASINVITNTTTFPLTTTKPNDTFILGEDLVKASGNGIIVNHSNCVFNFENKTLQFGVSVLFNNSRGISVNRNVVGTVVNGGNIEHRTPDLDSNGVGTEGGTGASCVYINWTTNVTFNGTNLFVDGHNAHCVHIPGGPTKNIKFNSGKWESNSNSFSSRETYGSAIFYSESFGTTLAADEFDVEIDGVTLLNSPHVGIVNKGKFRIENCTFLGDGRNIYWDSLYLNQGKPAGIGQGFANPYAILNRGIKAGSIIRNNFIGAGMRWGGSRGVLFESTTGRNGGTQELPIIVDNNVFDIHQGPDGENLGGTLRAVRIRGQLDYINFTNNRVFGIVDDDPKTTAIGREGTALHWGNEGGSHMVFENNIFEIVGVGTGNNFTGRSAMLSGDAFTFTKTNTFSGSGILVNFADMDNAVACSNWKIYDCNFIKGTLNSGVPAVINYSKFRTFSVGYPAKSSIGNVVIGGAYSDSSMQKDINFNTINGSHDLKTKTVFKITVTDNGTPKAGFGLGIRDAYSKTLFQGVTDTLGEAKGYLDYFAKATYFKDSSYSPYALSYTGEGNIPVVKTLDAHGISNYSIGTKGNLPPVSPVILTPKQDEVLTTNVVDLTWACSDPEGDSLFYDVYLGRTNMSIPVLTLDNGTVPNFSTTLGWDTAYYGYIRAFDNKGNTTPSQLFYFSTPKQPDMFPPVVSSVTWSQTEAVYGDTVVLTAKITDDFMLQRFKVTFNEVGTAPVTVYTGYMTGKSHDLALQMFPIYMPKAGIYEAVITAFDASGKESIGVSKELPVFTTALYQVKGGFLYIKGVRIDNITGELRLLEKK